MATLQLSDSALHQLAWAIEGASNYGTSGQVLTSNGNDAPTWQDAGAASVGGASAISMNDNVKINFGNSSDLQIYHNGTNSLIENSTGELLLRAKAGENSINCNPDGSVELFHDNSKKFHTNAGGVQVFGNLFSGDNAKHMFGDSNDLQIFHDGSNSFITDTGTGSLVIRSNQLEITKADGTEMMIRADTDGEVNLYYNGVGKLNTKSDGVDITGELQCDSLDVDGSSNFESVATFGGNYTSFNNNGYIRGDASGVFQLQAGSSNLFRFVNSSNNTTFAEITSGGFRPGANNTYDLGTSSQRWRNIYTNDLNLSNEGGGNDVDGTWGNYTIQEGEDDLFLINRRNGKKYKFNLTEVS